VAVVAVPVESTKLKGELLLAPAAGFQLLKATWPATSLLVRAVPVPTNWTLIGLTVDDEVMFNVKLVLWVVVLLVPVIVTVVLTGGVLANALSVSAEMPEAVIEVGLKDDVTPVGRPLTLRLTAPVNGPKGVMVTLIVALPPGATFSAAGADIEKSATVTVSVGGFGSVTPELSVTVRDTV
jgi:hypothetical protein